MPKKQIKTYCQNYNMFVVGSPQQMGGGTLGIHIILFRALKVYLGKPGKPLDK